MLFLGKNTLGEKCSHSVSDIVKLSKTVTEVNKKMVVMRKKAQMCHDVVYGDVER